MDSSRILASNPRYYFSCTESYQNELDLQITDLFYGVKTPIPCAVDNLLETATFNDQYQFAQFNSNHLIIILYPHIHFYILEIDPLNERSKILHRHETQFVRGKKVIFDQKDPRRFLAISDSYDYEGRLDVNRLLNQEEDYMGSEAVQIGQFSESYEEIEWKPLTLQGFDVEDSQVKFEENLLHGLNMTYNLETGKINVIKCWKLDLNVELGRLVDTFDFELKDDFEGFLHIFYQWKDTICYISNGSSIFSLDTQTKEACHIKIPLFDTLSFSKWHYSGWVVDEDDVLMICNENDSDMEIKRYPKNRPESLFMNTWMFVQKQRKTENGQKLYNQGKKMLPLNSKLQPFYFGPFTTNFYGTSEGKEESQTETQRQIEAEINAIKEFKIEKEKAEEIKAPEF